MGVAKVRPPGTADGDTKKPKDPPKKTTSTSSKSTTKTNRPAGRPTGIEKQLYEFFTTVGTIASIYNADDGMVIVQNAEPLSKAWADLAAKDARVKKAIETLMTGSAWSGVIFATGTVALAIAQNHDVVPSFGSDDPEPEPIPGPPIGSRFGGAGPTPGGTGMPARPGL